nr:hypothetical protein [Candidatus Sigynarchaeota archaeon]
MGRSGDNLFKALRAQSDKSGEESKEKETERNQSGEESKEKETEVERVTLDLMANMCLRQKRDSQRNSSLNKDNRPTLNDLINIIRNLSSARANATKFYDEVNKINTALTWGRRMQNPNQFRKTDIKWSYDGKAYSGGAIHAQLEGTNEDIKYALDHKTLTDAKYKSLAEAILYFVPPLTEWLKAEKDPDRIDINTNGEEVKGSDDVDSDPRFWAFKIR